ncbi:hypothetical protein CABS03_14919 [Colletotrichum abscissum]|nr:hypothetical protein CABS02_08218 [Colletotrichum abscissum]
MAERALQADNAKRPRVLAAAKKALEAIRELEEAVDEALPPVFEQGNRPL